MEMSFGKKRFISTIEAREPWSQRELKERDKNAEGNAGGEYFPKATDWKN